MKERKKGILQQLVGRTIENVLYAECGSVNRLLLFFSDGTHVEVYSSGELGLSTRLRVGSVKGFQERFEADRVDYELR